MRGLTSHPAIALGICRSGCINTTGTDLMPAFNISPHLPRHLTEQILVGLQLAAGGGQPRENRNRRSISLRKALLLREHTRFSFGKGEHGRLPALAVVALHRRCWRRSVCPGAGAGAADGLVELGNLGGSYLTATAVSAAGTAVVGEGDDAAFNPAFLWTPAAGTVNLGVLNGGDFSTATACNSDCTVIVSQANDGAAGGQPRAFRWTAGGGMVSLGTLPGGLYSFAAGVNTAGDVVVGYAGDGATANASRAFRWTAGSGLVNLGVLNGGSASAAAGSTAAGDVVVGQANDGAAGDQTRPSAGRRAPAWSASAFSTGPTTRSPPPSMPPAMSSSAPPTTGRPATRPGPFAGRRLPA